jgi:hypothetical protein
MISPLFAIARNTFTEVIRQPAYGVVVLATLAAHALSPALALFSLGEEAGALKEIGLSTLLLAGLVLSSLAASSVVRRELELRTTLTLLSKPVGRTTFLFAKFLGVAAALALASYLFLLALLLAARQGPPVTIHHPIDGPVLSGGLTGLFLALLGAAARNCLAGRPFSSSFAGFAAWTLSAGFLLAAFLDRDWAPQPFGAGFDPLLLGGAALAYLTIAVLAAFAVSVSPWVGRGGTFALTACLFLAGLAAGQEGGAGLLRRLLPDFRSLWIGELLYGQTVELSWGFLAGGSLHALAHATAYLFLGSWAFGKRSI